MYIYIVHQQTRTNENLDNIYVKLINYPNFMRKKNLFEKETTKEHRDNSC